MPENTVAIVLSDINFRQLNLENVHSNATNMLELYLPMQALGTKFSTDIQTYATYMKLLLFNYNECTQILALIGFCS